jgi:tripartite-type tricarboxylate transporter receptor subunit TctC
VTRPDTLTPGIASPATQPSRRTALAALAVACATPGAVLAQDTRPITLVVGYTPGSAFDTVARSVTDLAGKQLGQTIVIDNRAGAGGTIANGYFAKLPPDSRMLLLGGAGTHAVTAAVKTDLPYDTEKDFVAIVGLVTLPLVVVVPASSPIKTMQEFIEHARRNPGKINFASAGLGTSQHLSGELLKARTGIQMTHVAYRDSNMLKTDMTAGRLDIAFDTMASVQGLVDGGKLRVLAVTGPQRSPRLPGIPTLAEAGVKDMVVESWIGVFGPKGMPDAERERIYKAFSEAVNSEEGKKRLQVLGAQPTGTTPAAFDAMWRADLQRWRTFVKTADIKLAD